MDYGQKLLRGWWVIKNCPRASDPDEIGDFVVLMVLRYGKDEVAAAAKRVTAVSYTHLARIAASASSTIAARK